MISPRVTAAKVDANPSASMPVQLEVASSMGSYMLVVATTAFGLYSNDTKEYVWRVSVPIVSSDPSMPNDELS